MNSAGSFAIAAAIVIMTVDCSAGVLPDLPFAGPYGATVGAGSVLGWERNGMDANPAAMDPQRLGFAGAEYSPFDLQAVTIGEISISADGTHWGSSLAYRAGVIQADGIAQAWQVQSAANLGAGWSTGLALREQSDDWTSGSTVAFGTGILWNRLRFLTLGAMVQAHFSAVDPGDIEGGIGAGWNWSFGGKIPGGRLGVEAIGTTNHGWNERIGGELRLHPRLILYGGWSPSVLTWALGVEFKLGGWRGYHALRRHAALGATALEGLRYSRPWQP